MLWHQFISQYLQFVEVRAQREQAERWEQLTRAPPGEECMGAALMMLCEELRWLLRVQRWGCSVLKMEAAISTRRSPCLIRAPLYQDRKNCP